MVFIYVTPTLHQLIHQTLDILSLLLKKDISHYSSLGDNRFMGIQMIGCALKQLKFCGILCLVIVLLFSNLRPSSFAIILMGKRES